jgi:hypothetical protein
MKHILSGITGFVLMTIFMPIIAIVIVIELIWN